MTRVTTLGKFLYVDGRKWFVRGATYGAFAPNADGDQFPDRAAAVRDFALMREAGLNTILTYTVPPAWMLDELAEHGLRAIITTPWMEYACFLETAEARRQVRREVQAAVASCRRHPAVMMYCVGKEIPPPIVRWHGRKKVERFLRDLCDVARDEDPGSLVTYTNFPTTEYLELDFVDVYTFNVYLHERQAFCRYLSRLQHLAGELPMVLTEFGICSFRHGSEGQASFIDWQLEEIVDHGLSGAVVFGWTDPFYQDHCLVEEWGFGLVNADRRPKPSLGAFQRRLGDGALFPAGRHWPRMTVVVALYNAERTLDDCLSSLEHLNYPDYEVIVVDDGSTDGSAAIAARYPFRTISLAQNDGISAGRNVGMRAATGEIVAYMDSDARADPDWLTYLACTYAESDVAAVGGPNPVPAEDEWVAQCVFRAPGGPTQVMLDDRYAEHIPGVNMSFRKRALEEIDGFDVQFTTAADDVDVCWRLMDRGYRIGFNPSAVVWHHRRPSVRAYWRQQVGYGLSEARLERKFPNKFNGWGHTFWGGRIYAPYPFFRLFNRPAVYHGLWGSAPFQAMYDPGGGVWTFLPRAMEWHFAMAALMLFGVFFPAAWWLAGAALIYTVLYCGSCASGARIDNVIAVDGPPTLARRLKWRTMIAWLTFLEPIARDWGRLKGGLTPWRMPAMPATPAPALGPWWQRLQPFGRRVSWTYEGGPTLDAFPVLDALTKALIARGCAVGWNPVAETWDLKTRRGALGEAHVSMVVEHHGGPRRLARFSAALTTPQLIWWLIAIVSAVAIGAIVSERPAAIVFSLACLAAAWMAPILEAKRLEATVRDATDAVVRALDRTGD